MSTKEKATLEKFAALIKGITEEKTEKPRTKKGVVRELFAEIEAANLLGYSLEDILKTMKDNGFDSSFKLQTFYSIMSKIRKERGTIRKRGSKSNNSPPTQPDTKAEETELGVGGEKPMETNPLRALSGKKKPGEFNPIPPAKIEFD